MRKENIQYPHFEEQELQRILVSEDTEAVKKLIYQVVFQLAAAFQIPLAGFFSRKNNRATIRGRFFNRQRNPGA